MDPPSSLPASPACLSDGLELPVRPFSRVHPLGDVSGAGDRVALPDVSGDGYESTG